MRNLQVSRQEDGYNIAVYAIGVDGPHSGHGPFGEERPVWYVYALECWTDPADPERPDYYDGDSLDTFFTERHAEEEARTYADKYKIEVEWVS